jgi:uncharacterized protein with PIN domain
LPRKEYCFAVDASLGRLARHLRLLGFDTVYQAGGDAARFFNHAGQDRIALFRIRRLRGRLPQREWLFVHPNDPEAQVRTVLQTLNIGSGELRPFSRCVQCNRAVVALERAGLRGRVPDYVWQTQARFTGCPQCGRIFWPGTHTWRYQNKIKNWFKRSITTGYE